MELIESSEDISDFPEFISDTRHLWWETDGSEEPHSENGNSSWRKTPEISGEKSDSKDDDEFEFFGHIVL